MLNVSISGYNSHVICEKGGRYGDGIDINKLCMTKVCEFFFILNVPTDRLLKKGSSQIRHAKDQWSVALLF